MDQIRRLVGDISEAPFEYIDFSVSTHMGLFVPLTGQCDYAVTPEHTHPSYSFVVSFDDFCQVRIDDRILRSRADTFSGFSPGVPHQELPSDAPPRYVAVMIDRRYFENELRHYGEAALSLRGDVYPTPRGLLAALREFMAEFETRSPGFGQLLEASSLKIAHLIIRQLLDVSTAENRVDYRMAANRAIAFMHGNLAEKLTITDLARTARLSASHFARVFKQEMGVPPIEYLKELRLLRAKRLLRDTLQPITEIALSCGFGSSSYLARCFAARFDLTPSTFRKNLGVHEL